MKQLFLRTNIVEIEIMLLLNNKKIVFLLKKIPELLENRMKVFNFS